MRVKCIETTEWCMPDGSMGFFEKGKEYELTEQVAKELAIVNVAKIVVSRKGKK